MKRRNKLARPFVGAGLLMVAAVYYTTVFGRDILKSAWQTVKPRRPGKDRLECQYCCERKRDYEFIARGALPWNCQPHLSSANRVCKKCMDTALKAQLDSKPLIEIGCPQCGTPWEPEDVKMLVSLKTQRRFKELDKLARQQVLVPAELPDNATVDFLLDEATRFCPWCRWPFVKVGGCDSMLCSKCAKFFDIKYALILEDGSGRRAADIVQPANHHNHRA